MKELDYSKWNFTEESRVVILTGAGISAESGVQTFREADGLWEKHSIDDVATPQGFARNPSLVVDFYNARRSQLQDVSPNPAHIALAQWQQHLGDRLFLVTQNVDDLHERGGSSQVLHMHGELKKLRCLNERCRTVVTTEDPQELSDSCTNCGLTLRPHIVWFGEMPFDMDLIQDKLLDCTHFIYIGTSSKVYPAAGFKDIAKSRGAKVLCINLDIVPDAATDFYLEGKAGETLPCFTDRMMEAP